MVDFYSAVLKASEMCDCILPHVEPLQHRKFTRCPKCDTWWKDGFRVHPLPESAECQYVHLDDLYDCPSCGMLSTVRDLVVFGTFAP